ncbi:MAG: hypothetical protein ACI4IW_07040 [Oscillospiraceae bacterium]
MNAEKLWQSIGNIDPKFVEEAEIPPKKTGRRRFGIVLAAAVLMLLSVSTIATVRWYISLNDVFEKPPEVLREEEQLIEKTADTDEAEEPISVSVVSCLADERIMYLLWQVESDGTAFPKGASAEPGLSFGEASVDTALGYYGGQIEELCAGNVIAGYLVAEWSPKMQEAEGLFRIGKITVPEEADGEDYYPDIVFAMEQSKYAEGEENLRSEWPDEHFPVYQFLDIPAYGEERFYWIDYAEYRDGKLLLVIRHKMWSDDEEFAIRNKIMINSRTGEEAERIFSQTFVDKNGYNFLYYIYEVDYEEIGNLYFHIEGDTVSSTYIKGDWEIPFKAEATLKSVELQSAVEGVSIKCSPISMAITGDLPEMEYISVTLSDGSEASIINYDYDRIIFEQPVEPEKIVSVVINGMEYLKQRDGVQ